MVATQRLRYKAREMSEEERKAKKEAPLSDEEVARLEAVGVAWDVYATQWEKNYALLRAFREREGHANVPMRHVEEGEKLGVWLQTQRSRYQAGVLCASDPAAALAAARRTPLAFVLVTVQPPTSTAHQH